MDTPDEPPTGAQSPPSQVPTVRTTFASDLHRACGLGAGEVVDLSEDDGGPLEAQARVEELEGGAGALRYGWEGEIGHGGMGAVHRVFDRNLRRHLAMKVILPPGSPDEGTSAARQRELSSRFLEEAQITGQLEHPGVVPVHDLGLDEQGRLYFTMRLVRGRTFQEVIGLVARAAEGWSITRALGVLLKVCEAMSYAHDKGVIHRDLKPANVMVGRYGEVYVVDWGLARVEGREDPRDLRPRDEPASSLSTARRALRELRDDSPLVTMDGTVVGTPHYMSREQAVGRSDQVGPRSDVYAVGAMLYHLLTGSMPYSAPGERISPHTVLAMVIQGPPRPVHELAPQVPAELAAICERAMARDLEQRYPDMGALAEDLRAYLEGRVVRAYETGAVAELRKWVRRNRPLAAALVVALLLFVGGAAGIGYVEARSAARLEGLNEDLRDAYAGLEATNLELQDSNRRLDAERATSDRVVAFLTGMFRQEDPSFSRGASLTVKEVLDREAQRIALELREEPQVRARLMSTMGKVYQSLALRAEARPLLEGALEQARRLYGPDDPRTWTSQDELGSLLMDAGELDQALPLVEDALAARRAALGPEAEETLLSLYRLGTLRLLRGELEEADQLLQQALDGQEPRQGAGAQAVLETRLNLAAVHALSGRTQQAAGEYSGLARALTDSLGPGDPRTLFAQANRAFLLTELGQLAEAEQLCLEVLDRRTQVLGPDHADTLTSAHELARLHFLQGREEEAAAGFREAWQRRRERLGPDAPDTLLSLRSLAVCLRSTGRFDEALALYEEFLEHGRGTLAVDDPELVSALQVVRQGYLEQGRDEEAAALQREIEERSRAPQER